ncbi:hypothetical protein BV22DRAFT_1181630 [Leucogyrophana mollusca]|uniref:Uncharacterized protein n=1 Tax=Leucogyrophana mollusca TaxID=85980 RepID=A0ACB8B693_9AGAM|nr:hypothetical protein BV22DRAFT_1181630 [Leucogyrophana mollusca]
MELPSPGPAIRGVAEMLNFGRSKIEELRYASNLQKINFFAPLQAGGLKQAPLHPTEFIYDRENHQGKTSEDHRKSAPVTHQSLCFFAACQQAKAGRGTPLTSHFAMSDAVNIHSMQHIWFFEHCYIILLLLKPSRPGLATLAGPLCSTFLYASRGERSTIRSILGFRSDTKWRVFEPNNTKQQHASSSPSPSSEARRNALACGVMCLQDSDEPTNAGASFSCGKELYPKPKSTRRQQA